MSFILQTPWTRSLGYLHPRLAHGYAISWAAIASGYSITHRITHVIGSCGSGKVAVRALGLCAVGNTVSIGGRGSLRVFRHRAREKCRTFVLSTIVLKDESVGCQRRRFPVSRQLLAVSRVERAGWRTRAGSHVGTMDARIERRANLPHDLARRARDRYARQRIRRL